MDEPDERTPVVCDTCVLITFMEVGRFDLLRRHGTYRFMITNHVREEITDQDQSAMLEEVLQSNDIAELELTSPDELTTYAHLRAFLGKGEAASIAAAQCRGYVVACDELRRTRREILSRLGPDRLLTSSDIIKACVNNRMLSQHDGDELQSELSNAADGV